MTEQRRQLQLRQLPQRAPQRPTSIDSCCGSASTTRAPLPPAVLWPPARHPLSGVFCARRPRDVLSSACTSEPSLPSSTAASSLRRGAWRSASSRAATLPTRRSSPSRRRTGRRSTRRRAAERCGTRCTASCLSPTCSPRATCCSTLPCSRASPPWTRQCPRHACFAAAAAWRRRSESASSTWLRAHFAPSSRSAACSPASTCLARISYWRGSQRAKLRSTRSTQWRPSCSRLSSASSTWASSSSKATSPLGSAGGSATSRSAASAPYTAPRPGPRLQKRSRITERSCFACSRSRPSSPRCAHPRRYSTSSSRPFRSSSKCCPAGRTSDYSPWPSRRILWPRS